MTMLSILVTTLLAVVIGSFFNHAAGCGFCVFVLVVFGHWYRAGDRTKVLC